MSVLIDNRNLIVGNGDVFLASVYNNLPSISAYKAAQAAGSLASIPGCLGGIKATVNIQLIRELAKLELGIPQQVVDQTCIREGVHFEAQLVELSLGVIQQQLGLANNYTVTSNGPVYVVSEANVLAFDTNGNPNQSAIAFAPILFTTSTPAAPVNPIVTSPITTTTTDTGGTDFDSSSDASGNVASTAGWVAGKTVIQIGTEQILVGAVGSGTSVSTLTRGYNSTTPAAHASGSAVTVVFQPSLDYTFCEMLNSIAPVVGGAVSTTTNVLISYYYNQLSAEVLTGGGNADVNNVALAFFHTYKSGLVSRFAIRKCNPVGSVTVPNEETEYTKQKLEFQAIADLSQSPGQQLYVWEREVYVGFRQFTLP